MEGIEDETSKDTLESSISDKKFGKKTVEDLQDFLDKLKNDISNNNLSEDKLFKVTEFYLDYTYGHLLQDKDSKDSLKYLMLGWYFYNILF